ncbi:hypothetical protein V1264_005982 [Littorina saxatilis]|uniref:Uncharacterized protein n=1 Tax=Littorina saxatilis TaxID=31220 RepID=A0AAN9AWU1_9CAEN
MFLRVAVLVMSLVVTVRASCHGGAATTNDAGEPVCVVDGEELAVDEQRVTATCQDCTCYLSGYQCCGVGYNAGSIGVPDGQRLVKDDNCAFHLEPV